MADDIKAMTAELARDPASLVFLRLGEALRTRGQTDSAARIAASGVVRHPDLSAAHDLYARVLIDLGDFERAYHEWTVGLELDPGHLGAHKGLGFLCYRWGDLDGAVEHLEFALAADPTDQTVVQALQRVREGSAPPTEPAAGPDAPPAPEEPRASAPRAPPTPPTPWEDLEGGGGDGILLVDERGLVLTGSLHAVDGADIAEEVAAHLAGAAQEAERTARLLELGEWRSMLVEGDGGNLLLARPSERTVLLMSRDRSVPQGRLGVLAERASRRARQWLKEQRR